jgi:hypothetical protein
MIEEEKKQDDKGIEKICSYLEKSVRVHPSIMSALEVKSHTASMHGATDLSTKDDGNHTILHSDFI